MRGDGRYSTADVADLPMLWDGDVVVVGGGSAGCPAAVSAARNGASVLLIERAGFLGGTGAAVLDSFYGFFAPGSDDRVVGGTGWRLCEHLLAEGQAFLRPSSYGAGTAVTYEPEALKHAWDRFVESAGCTLLLRAVVTGAVVDEGTVTGLTVETVTGTRRVIARAVVDASGDAEVAWRAGAGLTRPHEERLTQPATATFRVGGVHQELASQTELRAAMAHAVTAGQWALPRVDGSTHRTLLPGVQHTNLTRVSGLDVTDPWDLSRAEVEGRRQAREYFAFLRSEVRGFADAFLMSTSAMIGVRESRRLIGRAVLQREDVLAARDFADAIARCGAPLEDHAAGDGTKWSYVGGPERATGQTYGIPFGCLLPREVRGLLVAGRCLSASHDAHASVRSMGTCMAMGDAAGTGAALAVRAGCQPDELDVAELRKTLRADGAVL